MFDEKFLSTIWADKLADREVVYDETRVRFFDVESSCDQPLRFGILLNLTPRDSVVQSPAKNQHKESEGHDSEKAAVPIWK